MKSDRTNYVRFDLEALEARAVPAAGIELTFMAGIGNVLKITGTNNADFIYVDPSSNSAPTIHAEVQDAAGKILAVATVPDALVNAVWIDALDGNDTVIVNISQPDYLFGGNGADTLLAGYGDSFLDGGPGSDYLEGWFGNDLVLGWTGHDTLTGGSGTDSLYGEDGNDSLDGGDDEDYLEGGLGNDSLLGGLAADIMHGGSGNDTLKGNDGADQMWGGSGADQMWGGYGDDVMSGGSGDDVLYGNSGNDALYGNDGADCLYGDSGNDYLDGGRDLTTDFLTGGTGTDTFVQHYWYFYGYPYDTVYVEDAVLDFTLGDDMVVGTYA